MVWFTATVSRYFVHGPYKGYYYPMANACQKEWWADILYINNYAIEKAQVRKFAIYIIINKS